MKPTDIPIICLMGPTATGKTDAAACIYEELNASVTSAGAEIISVDSSLVYTGMDIGTAKPDAEFLQKYPHHLIDVCHPNDSYSVAEFYKDTTALIKQITEQGKVPILAGGTMFYFNALEHGLTELPAANDEVRQAIAEQAEQKGWAALHTELAELDPQSAERIDPHDAQRIQRALEIVTTSGKTVSAHNANKKSVVRNPMLKIALSFSDRSYLHQRIEQRFDIMLEQGFQAEVEALLEQGVDPLVASMKMIGYRQMLDFLQERLTYDDMRFKGIVATRQLAKRQLTWLRNQANMLWWVDDGLKDKNFSNLMTYLAQIVGNLSYNKYN